MLSSQENKPTECEACPNTENLKFKYGMWMCPDCIIREDKLQAASNAGAEQRVLDMRAMMDKARAVDASIQVKTDIFNAETVSIADIKKAIDEDPEIENKAFKLAEIVMGRYNQYKQVIFDLNQQVVDATNKQRAAQQYLNNLANSLRQEEREKLKLQDVNYQPQAPKSVKPRTAGANKKKAFNMEELKFEVNKLHAEGIQIPLAAIQMLCTAKNLTPVEACNSFRKNTKEIESENNNG